MFLSTKTSNTHVKLKKNSKKMGPMVTAMVKKEDRKGLMHIQIHLET